MILTIKLQTQHYSNTIFGCNYNTYFDNASVMYPKEIIKSYEGDTYWKQFAERIPIALEISKLIHNISQSCTIIYYNSINECFLLSLPIDVYLCLLDPVLALSSANY